MLQVIQMLRHEDKNHSSSRHRFMLRHVLHMVQIYITGDPDVTCVTDVTSCVTDGTYITGDPCVTCVSDVTCFTGSTCATDVIDVTCVSYGTVHVLQMIHMLHVVQVLHMLLCYRCCICTGDTCVTGNTAVYEEIHLQALI